MTSKAKGGLGASIKYVDKQGGERGSPKCQRYYISLFSKLVKEGEGGQKSSKFCQRILWMPPNLAIIGQIYLVMS